MRKTGSIGGLRLSNKGDFYAVTTIDAVVDGRNGNDRILGGEGNDRLYGGNGSDKLYGGAGNDVLCGGNGMDGLCGAAGDDALHGGNGKDRLLGGDGNDRLFGGNGRDALAGGSGDDLIYGGNGGDWIQGGYGVDTMSGGNGPDRFVWRNADVTTIAETDPSYPQGLLTTSEGDASTGDAPTQYAWVRSAADGGAVGVTEDYANGGYGSLLLNGSDPTNDSGYAAKAGYEWDPALGLNAADDGGAADDTTLGSLTALGYDWYRDSSSSSPDTAVPTLTLLVDLDGDMTTTGDRLALSIDPTNGSAAAEDLWNTTALDLTDPGTVDFQSDFGSINLADVLSSGVIIDDGITNLGTLSKDSLVYGVEVGIGGATGDLIGAVDNVIVGFHDDEPTIWNFETGPSQPDIIVDFTSHVDKLALCDLLTGYTTGADINNFVQATTDGAGDTTVSINEDGLGTDWTALVVLKGATIDITTDIVV